MNKVNCILLGAELEALESIPYPGDLGKRIFKNISKNAWEKWLGHQTILINEYRLSPINADHRKFLEDEMEKFFFGDGSEKPKEFVGTE